MTSGELFRTASGKSEISQTPVQTHFILMPPTGWRKPPGYGGYVRRARTRPGAGRPPRKRTAGPDMLPSRRSNEAAAIAESDGEDSQDSNGDDVPDDAGSAQPEGALDLISSRTRGGKRPAEQLTQTDSHSESDASENDGTDARANSDTDASDQEQSEHDEEMQNTRVAAQRRPAARVLFDDPLDDRPSPPSDCPSIDDAHILELSVTLSKTKGHVHPAWLQLVADWMQLRCVSGACALERGGRQQHLHLQIMLRMRIDSKDLASLKDELKSLVGWRRGDGSGTYCSVKQFGVGQVSKDSWCARARFHSA